MQAKYRLSGDGCIDVSWYCDPARCCCHVFRAHYRLFGVDSFSPEAVFDEYDEPTLEELLRRLNGRESRKTPQVERRRRFPMLLLDGVGLLAIGLVFALIAGLIVYVWLRNHFL